MLRLRICSHCLQVFRSVCRRAALPLPLVAPGRPKVTLMSVGCVGRHGGRAGGKLSPCDYQKGPTGHDAPPPGARTGNESWRLTNFTGSLDVFLQLRPAPPLSGRQPAPGGPLQGEAGGCRLFLGVCVHSVTWSGSQVCPLLCSTRYWVGSLLFFFLTN